MRAAALCLVAGIFLASCARQQPVTAKQESSGPIGITVAPVHSRQITRVVDSVGTMFPYEEAIISAEVDGKVDQVTVDLGDVVKEGQTLVRIAEEEQRYLLQQTEAQMRSAMERLGLRNEKDRIADIKQTPDMRRAQADLFEAEQRFRRTRDLKEQGVGAQQDLDQAQARYQAALAALDQTANQTRNLIQEVERVRGALELQRKKLRDTTVKAPFTAHVKDRQVTVGQFVRVNTPLLTLVKTDPVRLRIEVPERMAPWLRTGQTAEVVVEAFADRKFNGKIWRISPTVDQTKRTFVVEALLQNGAGELKPGSYARAKVPTGKVDRVLLVPQRAVTYVLGANKAFVVHDGKIDAREVKIGDRFEQEIEILEGLEEGEQVATSQLLRLDSGVRVSVVTEDRAPEKKAQAKPAE